VEVLVIPADLADPDAPDSLVRAIEARGRTVDMLVNNAGYGLPGGYAATTWDDQRAFLQVMLVAVCQLTHRLLPGMLARGYGRIVNVASLAGLVPGGPGHTLYGADKAFLIRFSQSLRMETLNSGVHVSALCPGFTLTEFHDVNGVREQVSAGVPAWAWMEADAVVRAGLAAVERNQAVCVPGLANKAAALIAKLTPEAWIMALMARESHRFRQL
jgi:short-subunit dehydrogenase